MRAISITVDLLLQLKMVIIKVKLHMLIISNYTLYIVKFSLDLILCFSPIFVDFQNEATGLCVNNSIDKDTK